MKNIYSLILLLILQFHIVSPCFSQETRGIIVQKNTKSDSTVGNTYAIIVGISEYPYLKPLHFADKDAELFRDFLLSPAGGNVKPENMHVLLNENATSANFWVKGFAWLRNKNLQKGDRLYFYFAGHGDAIDKDQYFFLPYDCSPGGDKNNYLATGAIQIYNLKVNIEKLSNIGVDVLLIMDACRSNELPGGAAGQKILGEAIAEKRSGETMMLAASSGQESLEDHSIGNGHGLFTWYLIDGLSGKADADIENGNQNGKVELDEIESWVKRNVRKVAQQRFNHEQVPYFCCTGTAKTITKVDSSFLKQWIIATKINTDASEKMLALNIPNTSRGTTEAAADSNVIKLYNQFNRCIKDNRLTGDSAAGYWYNKMLKQFPKHSYTEEAKYTLTTEFINFAQEKINLYLTGNDYKFVFGNDSSNKRFLFEQRFKAVAKEPFYKVADMLEKGLALSKEFDSSIEKRYLAKLYFLKARGSLGEEDWMLGPRMDPQNNVKKALEYAYAALKIDSNAAYIYHLLAKLQFSKNWETKYDSSGGSMTYSHTNETALDSVSFYERKAMGLAPLWSYVYYYLGNIYTAPAVSYHYDTTVNGSFTNDHKLDSAALLMKKCLEINPQYVPAIRVLANLSNRKNDIRTAIDYIKKAREIEPGNENLMNDLVAYNFKLSTDSGMYYYNKFGGIGKQGIFYPALCKLSRYFIDRNDMAMSIFICKEQLASPGPDYTGCDVSPRYALSKNRIEISDTLFKMVSGSNNTWVKMHLFYNLAMEYDFRKDYKKAIDYYLKGMQYDSNVPPEKYYYTAGCYAHLGNRDSALYYLEKSLEKGYNDFEWVQKDPQLDLIRNTARFKALMQQYSPGKLN